MLVKCTLCGSYEVGSKVYDELAALPESHWQIVMLREGLERVRRPIKVVKANTNIIEIQSLDEKLTKMQKKILRKRAEGRGPTVGGVMYHVGEDNK